MASTGKKEYTLKINGINQSVKDVTTLEATLNALDVSLNKTRETTVKTTTETKKVTQALTDEEKAAKKLADTQKRVTQVNGDANRAQIEANLALREATRETTRNIAINQLAEGSIAQMGMQLTDLRNEYEQLTAAQRIDEEQGGKMLAQIQSLDAEYKALRESTGNFRDSVGNYEKGFKGLNELKDKFELAARGSVNLAADVAGTNDVLDAFGATTDTVAKSSEQLAGVMALATVAEEAYNAVIKENVIQNTAASVIDGVRSIQLKAKTAAEALATKGTIAATAAQWALNVAAAANPYVLLALALVAVVGALYAFASSTDTAAESQNELNAIQAQHLDLLDQQAAKLKEVSDRQVKDAEVNLAVLNARGAKVAELRKAEDQLNNEREFANAEQRGFYFAELEALEANRKKIDELRKVLAELNIEKAKGNDKIKLDIDLDGKVDKVKIDEAITAVQGSIDNLGRSVKVAVDLNDEKAELADQARILAAQRLKEDGELAKDRAAKAKEARAAELAAVRQGQDARIQLIANSYERERKIINITAARAIEDIKQRLATEKTLTVKAREALNDNIKSLILIRNKDLKELDDARAAAQLETARAMQDSDLDLIISGGAKRRAQITAQYSREIEDLQKRLDTEKSLTQQQRDDLQVIIINKREQQNNELAALDAEALQNEASAELRALDSLLAASEQKIGEVTKRSKTGFKLIDVDATRANLAETNKALADYVDNVKKYQKDLQTAHEATLATLEEGTPEYVDEVQKYTDAQLDATKRIQAAEKEREANTKASTEVQADYYADLAAKVATYAQLASDVIGGVVDTVNMGIQSQIDTMTEQLDAVTEKYEEAKNRREEATENVEELEARTQNATGATAAAFKNQLADAMAARNQAARDEQKLQKEKEKREAEIAKKEKQMKRNELIGNIAMTLANTAMGVARAFADWPFPLSAVIAGITGAIGLVQVGIMTNQLTKLEDGGPIVGPSHADGGVPIGLGYEAEGGEYVINKRSYAANGELVRFINENPQGLTASDLLGLVPSDTTPANIDNAPQGNNADVVDALNNINFSPVVSVTDINTVNEQLTTVQDLAGF